MVTACYYLSNNYKLDNLKTELFIDGVIKDSVLHGDLYLKGYGDPTLKTDDFPFLLTRKKFGCEQVLGSLFYDNSYLPDINYINRNQLPQYAYNPGMGAINLNENRILFEWKRLERAKYKTSLTAPGLKYCKSNKYNLDLENDKGPVYSYELDETKFKERWSVNKRILGKKGSRWLPVRESSYYATEALKQLLVDKVLKLKIWAEKVPKKSELCALFC